MRLKLPRSSICRYESGEAMMTDGNVPAPCPPFVVHDDFLETAFELRFQGLLQQAWRQRTWHVIAALPGSGKSLGIADLTHHSNSRKDTKRPTPPPLLTIPPPNNLGTNQPL